MKTDAYAIYYLLFIFVDKFRVDGGVHSMHLNVSDIHKLFLQRTLGNIAYRREHPVRQKMSKNLPKEDNIVVATVSL